MKLLFNLFVLYTLIMSVHTQSPFKTCVPNISTLITQNLINPVIAKTG